MKWKQKRHLLVSLLFKKVREEWGLGALMFNLMALRLFGGGAFNEHG